MHEWSGLGFFFFFGVSSVYDGVKKMGKSGWSLDHISVYVICGDRGLVLKANRDCVRLVWRRGGRTRRSPRDFTRLLRLWLERGQGSSAWLAHVAQKRENNGRSLSFSSSLKSSFSPGSWHDSQTLELAFTALARFICPCLGPFGFRPLPPLFCSGVIFFPSCSQVTLLLSRLVKVCVYSTKLIKC